MVYRSKVVFFFNIKGVLYAQMTWNIFSKLNDTTNVKLEFRTSREN